MKRDITTILEIKIKSFVLTVIEKIGFSYVEIFKNQNDLKKIDIILPKYFENINKIVAGKISDVFVVIEKQKNINFKNEIFQKGQKIDNVPLTMEFYNSFLESIKQKYEDKNFCVSLIQPIKFQIDDKTFAKIPLNKKCKNFNITCNVFMIERKIYDYIEKFLQKNNLNLIQMYTSEQILSQNNISIKALQQGAILLNIDYHKTFLTINRFLTTVGFSYFYDFGIKDLLKGIVKIFNCKMDEAQKIMQNFGTLKFKKKQENFLIYKNKANNQKLYINDLTAIINLFFKKLFTKIQEILIQKKINSMPLVISGDLNYLDGLLLMFKQKLNNQMISLYNPLTFLEINNNFLVVGVLKLKKRLDEINGYHHKKLIETDPNLFSSMLSNMDKMKDRVKIFKRTRGK